MPPITRERGWIVYDWNVNRSDRKATIRKLIATGMNVRDAIDELRSIERRDQCL